jgi:hypothetical protein
MDFQEFVVTTRARSTHKGYRERKNQPLCPLCPSWFLTIKKPLRPGTKGHTPRYHPGWRRPDGTPLCSVPDYEPGNEGRLPLWPDNGGHPSPTTGESRSPARLPGEFGLRGVPPGAPRGANAGLPPSPARCRDGLLLLFAACKRAGRQKSKNQLLALNGRCNALPLGLYFIAIPVNVKWRVWLGVSQSCRTTASSCPTILSRIFWLLLWSRGHKR